MPLSNAPAWAFQLDMLDASTPQHYASAAVSMRLDRTEADEFSRTDKVEKERREYPNIAPAGAIYARAVKAGQPLYISGCTTRETDAEGGDPLDQLKTVLDRIIAIVEVEGGVPSDVVKLTTYVTNMADWYPIPNEHAALYEDYFRGENPANTLVEVSALALPTLCIEIEAIAILG